MILQLRRLAPLLAALLLGVGTTAFAADRAPPPAIGDVMDRFNGVAVYFNGPVAHSGGISRAPDGYVYGLRYQCVEFIKRYYDQHLAHRMPRPTGNAREYFDPNVADGALNPARGLIQYRNGSAQAPQVDDILVFGPWPGNRFGHVGIVSAVGAEAIEIVQQNPGPRGHSRRLLPLLQRDGAVRVDHPWVLGWLRLPAGAAGAAPSENGP